MVPKTVVIDSNVLKGYHMLVIVQSIERYEEKQIQSFCPKEL